MQQTFGISAAADDQKRVLYISSFVSSLNWRRVLCTPLFNEASMRLPWNPSRYLRRKLASSPCRRGIPSAQAQLDVNSFIGNCGLDISYYQLRILIPGTMLVCSKFGQPRMIWVELEELHSMMTGNAPMFKDGHFPHAFVQNIRRQSGMSSVRTNFTIDSPSDIVPHSLTWSHAPHTGLCSEVSCEFEGCTINTITTSSKNLLYHSGNS